MTEATETESGLIIPSLVSLEDTTRLDPDEAPTTPELLDFGMEFFYDHWTQAGRRGRSKGSYFRASSLGSCPRVQLYKRAGVPSLRVLDTKTKRKFQWGDDIEWFVKHRLEMLGLHIASGIEIDDDELNLSGTFDILWGGMVQPVREGDAQDLWNRMHDRLAVLMDTYSLPAGSPFSISLAELYEFHRQKMPTPEWVEFLTKLREKLIETHGQQFPVTLDEVKSQHSFAMKKRYKEGASPQHMMQLAAYKVLAERNPDALPTDTIDRYRNLLVGKDAVGYLYFPLPDGATDEVLGKLEMLNHWWDKGIIPPCTCDAESWMRAYCDYGDGSGDSCCEGFEEQFEEARNGNVHA